MKFHIEQVALCPKDTPAARRLLEAVGLTAWVEDTVVATGKVFGQEGRNTANLAFNYDASGREGKPLELEVLNYTAGANWMERAPNTVSHLGMHVTAAELDAWREKFAELEIPVAQEVFTESHTNEFLKNNGRKYNYVIFDTRDLLGVDLKFIVRIEA